MGNAEVGSCRDIWIFYRYLSDMLLLVLVVAKSLESFTLVKIYLISKKIKTDI